MLRPPGESVQICTDPDRYERIRRKLTSHIYRKSAFVGLRIPLPWNCLNTVTRKKMKTRKYEGQS